MPVTSATTTVVPCASNPTVCGDNLRRAVVSASLGDVLELEDGTYGGESAGRGRAKEADESDEGGAIHQS